MKSTSLNVIVLLLACGLAAGEVKNKGWWKNAVFYQVYPRSFMDSNGDGIGDLEGIRSKIAYFQETGITGIWLSPIYESPQKDFGYDISNFTAIDSTYGTMEHLEALIRDAHKLGIKVILDLVPNHTSDQHVWFKLSLNGTGKYKDYYIWSDGKKVEGKEEPEPPNNWLSVFNGSAWTYSKERKQLYFHQFYKEQPDLDYSNENVQAEMKEVMKFWLDKGVDGFRIDAVPHLFEGDISQNEPVVNVPGAKPTDHVSLSHILTKDQPKTYDLVQSWRKFVDDYAAEKGRDEIVLMTEAYTSWENTTKFYDYGSNIPFNFKFITDANASSSAMHFKNIIDKWISMTPKTGIPNWVMGNHDRVRIATRYPGRADQMIMLEMILPGVAVTYYGEEIGMKDYTSGQVMDFRDGCRTPFQWNASSNAGFSTNKTTWLPVDPTYGTVNLESEKKDPNSNYTLYTDLIKLRKSETLKSNSLETAVLNNQVLAIVRKGQAETVTLLINFNDTHSVTVNLESLVRSSNTKIKLRSVNSGLQQGSSVTLSSVTLPAKASVVLVSGASTASCSIFAMLLLAIITFFKS